MLSDAMLNRSADVSQMASSGTPSEPLARVSSDSGLQPWSTSCRYPLGQALSCGRFPLRLQAPGAGRGARGEAASTCNPCTTIQVWS